MSLRPVENIPRFFRLLCCVLAVTSPLMCAADDTAALSDLARSSFVHCAFYRHYDTDPATGEPLLVEGEGDALMFFEGIDIGHARARAIYTRIAGQRSVVMIRTGKALHFIDNVAGMYIMTTIYSCLEYGANGRCVTYGAVKSMSFDSSVLTEPDRVYEATRADADLGFCDHSFIGAQPAAHDLR
ncbi:MAG TPA: hypothetical protein VMT94_06980 [Burkholderiales bacterium]|nr:hypothetical protein [Burkholderiales bacterium]